MPSIVRRLLSSIKSLILRQVCYQDKLKYKLDQTPALTAVEQHKSNIVILSRHGYTEQLQWLPVSRNAAAKKLVKYQAAAKGEGCFYSLGQPVNGKTPVIWYQLKAEKFTSTTLLFLPETLLLGMHCQIGQVFTYYSPDSQQQVFVTKTAAGYVSAVKGAVIQTASQFMLAHGAKLDKETPLSSAQLSAMLQSSLFNVQQLALPGLINSKGFKRNSTTFSSAQRYIWPLAISITLYLFTANEWAGYQNQQNRLQFQQANARANSLLLQREHIDTMLQRYQQVQTVLPAHANLLQLWAVMAPMYQHQVTVQFVQQRQQVVTLRIEAVSATEALQLLVKQPGVVNARLEGNVRRQGDRDVATVSFELKQEAA